MSKPRTAKSSHHSREIDASDHLSALGKLVEGAFPDPLVFFDHGLELLLGQLGVDWALMARLSERGLESYAWAIEGGEGSGAVAPEPARDFCPHVLEYPNRPLVIRDAAVDGLWRHHGAFRELGVRAFLGVTLRASGKQLGVLSVSARRARDWRRAEISMVRALADLFGKTLEVEQLKHELRLTRDALDLTTAVVEDSALDSSATGLPNRHYLDIWLKANLYLARRRGEVLSVAYWKIAINREVKKYLREISEALRGEDLLVDLGRDEFLLLLPHTSQSGAQVLLERIRLRLGPIAMGATLWVPLHKVDRNDLAIQAARHRASLALERSREISRSGSAEIVWDVPFLGPEDLADATNTW